MHFVAGVPLTVILWLLAAGPILSVAIEEANFPPPGSRVSLEDGISPRASKLRSAVFVNDGPCAVGDQVLLAVILPNVSSGIEVTVNFSDGSEPVTRGSQSFVLGGYHKQPGYSCMFVYRYHTGGEYLARAIIKNPNHKYPEYRKISLKTIVRIKCNFPTLEIVGGSLTQIKPLGIRRSETKNFHVTLTQDCTDQTVRIEWVVSLVGEKDKADSENNVLTDQKAGSNVAVVIMPYTLQLGLYSLKITGKVPYHNAKKVFIIKKVVWFEVISSPLTAVIDGPLSADSNETVEFNAFRSSDPDVNPLVGSSSSSLNFTWYCLPGEWELNELFKLVPDSFKGHEGCLYDKCACRSENDTTSNSSYEMVWPHDDVYRQAFPFAYTVALRAHVGARSSMAVQSLEFDIPNLEPKSGQGIPLHLISDVPIVEIFCLSNCLEHVDHSRPLVLFAQCRNCIAQETLAYEWDFEPAHANCSVRKINWDDDTLTGKGKAWLVVPTQTFGNLTENESYQFFVTVMRLSEKQSTAGFSVYFAKYGATNTHGSNYAKALESDWLLKMAMPLGLLILRVHVY